MGARWRDLFKHAVAEAERLGLEVNMNDDAGWNGSGGPWIKPEQSMQKVVWTETSLSQARGASTGTFRGRRPIAGYYRDIAVLAFPTPGEYRIPNIKGKALYERKEEPPASDAKLPAETAIDPARLVDLTARMDPDGRLAWDVPAGRVDGHALRPHRHRGRERAGAGQRPRAGVRQAEPGRHRGPVRRNDGQAHRRRRPRGRQDPGRDPYR